MSDIVQAISMKHRLQRLDGVKVTLCQTNAFTSSRKLQMIAGRYLRVHSALSYLSSV